MLTDTVQALLGQYKNGPVGLKALVSTLSSGEIASKPIPGKWTPLELICHLADSEMLFAERMKRVLVEDEPKFHFSDPSICAVKLKYQQRNANVEFMCTEATRLQMSAILVALDTESWQRKGIHPKEGLQSLVQLLENPYTILSITVENWKPRYLHSRTASYAISPPSTTAPTNSRSQN